MSVYEVKASTYLLVEADSEEEAIAKAQDELNKLDLVFDDYSAFEEDISDISDVDYAAPHVVQATIARTKT